MKWVQTTRTSGETGSAGEFVVEDQHGNEWQVRAIETASGAIQCLKSAVCLNAGYEAGIELEGDLFTAVREHISGEIQ